MPLSAHFEGVQTSIRMSRAFSGLNVWMNSSKDMSLLIKVVALASFLRSKLEPAMSECACDLSVLVEMEPGIGVSSSVDHLLRLKTVLVLRGSVNGSSVIGRPDAIRRLLLPPERAEVGSPIGAIGGSMAREAQLVG